MRHQPVSTRPAVAGNEPDVDVRPFELTMRLRNNLLKARRISLGLTVRQMAERIGIPYTTYLALEGIRLSPMLASGKGWSKPALRVSDFYKCLPDDLFPGVVLAVACPVIVRQMSEREMIPLLANQAAGVTVGMLPQHAEELEDKERSKRLMDLARLGFRERKVVEMRFGINQDREWTLDEIAKKWGVSRTRPAQVLSQALWKMREAARIHRI